MCLGEMGCRGDERKRYVYLWSGYMSCDGGDSGNLFLRKTYLSGNGMVGGFGNGGAVWKRRGKEDGKGWDWDWEGR